MERTMCSSADKKLQEFLESVQETIPTAEWSNRR